jgi:hypothetical protein
MDLVASALTASIATASPAQALGIPGAVGALVVPATARLEGITQVWGLGVRVWGLGVGFWVLGLGSRALQGLEACQP